MNHSHPVKRLVLPLACLLLGLVWLAACGKGNKTSEASSSSPTPAPSSTKTPIIRADGLTEDEATTLGSLEKVDEYPLYSMRYSGGYRLPATSIIRPGSKLSRTGESCPLAWGCSLFAALGNEGDRLYGRNFDWEFSPAVLLFTDPPDGYASVSMVDIAYLGFGGERSGKLLDLPLAERRSLLNAPFLPFDGMNEKGLAIGMAAVPPGNMNPDPGKETIDSILAIRLILDKARDVEEAVALLRKYNIDMSGGPPIHYLIADAGGHAALVEFYNGKMVVLPNEKPWHQATNFLRSSVGDPKGQCQRYDRISERMAEAGGRLSGQAAMQLLEEVSQDITQWSVIYHMSTGEVQVVTGKQYQATHTFQLHLAKDKP